jgi:hypothetical protein
MFILYAIPIGILIGYVLGGRLDRLSRLRIRWAPLAILGLAVQIAIFSEPLGSAVGEAGPAVYVASTVLVFVAVLRNLAIPGVAIIAIGAASNLAAIIANGGSMPADPAAIASIGGLPSGATNSVVIADPVLKPLTDLFALPAWMPFANVFSVGDVLIGVGIACTIALAMRATRPATPPPPAIPPARPGRGS